MTLARNLAILLLLVPTGCTTVHLFTSAATARMRSRVSLDDGFLEKYARTRRFSLGRPRSTKLTPDGNALLFLRSASDSFVQDLFELDTRTGEERRLLTAEEILKGAEEHLTAEEKARRERMRMTARGIATYHLSLDGKHILVPLSGRLFVVDRNPRKVVELTSDKGFPIDPKFSPDGKKVGCVRNGDLYVIDIASNTERRLTHRAGEHETNGLSEFVAQEEMGRYSGFWWSPDSARIAYQKTDTTGMENMHIMDAMYPDRAPHVWPYPRPGKKNADVSLGVIAATGGETTWVTWDRERFNYLVTVKWKKNAPLTILLQNREQTEETLYSVDHNSGYLTELMTERDPAWINLDQSMPYWLPDGSAFLWTTERHGFWLLEIRNRDGSLRHRITPPGFNLKGFVSYDETSQAVYVSGCEDPTQTHIYRLEAAHGPNTPVPITTRPGAHRAQFAKNHQAWLHSASLSSGESYQRVKRIDPDSHASRTVTELKSNAEAPPFIPQVEWTIVGKDPQFHAVIIRPRDFVEELRYPVIVSVYGGPHAQMVSATPRRYLMQQWMADHGFIVVAIDGRGTPSRGREWERIIKGDLISVPLRDQVAGLKALGRRYPEMDMSRVGITGWSFGGYFSAHAVMQRPDVFHVGVAGAPVCAWEDYDTHYTERYMGLPQKNAKGYEAANVLTYCDRLERPLLIIHGTADDNVYFAHALKMSDALFRAGKEHDFLPLSGFTHMVASPQVTKSLQGRVMNYFLTHLRP